MRISKTWSIGIFKELGSFELMNGGQPENLVFKLSGRKLRTRYRHNAVYADPFLFTANGELYLFAEIQPIDEVGFINGWQYIQDSEWLDIGPVLKDAIHYSYPFIFQDVDGKIYMIPEAHQSKEISLWEFSKFPAGLKKIKTILKGIYFDSNIILHNGTYYVFTKNEKDEQVIYYADSLLSDNWIPHSGNPVTTDPKISRNGGGVIKRENNLLRIAQNNTSMYGEGIVVLRITKLDKNNYEERVIIDDYKPSGNYIWQRKGRHHLSLCSFKGKTFVAMDGLANNQFINVFINAYYKLLRNGLFNRNR